MCICVQTENKTNDKKLRRWHQETRQRKMCQECERREEGRKRESKTMSHVPFPRASCARDKERLRKIENCKREERCENLSNVKQRRKKTVDAKSYSAKSDISVESTCCNKNGRLFRVSKAYDGG